MQPRPIWDEIFERYGVELGGLLDWLVLEAQYRSDRAGIVYGTLEEVAAEIGWNWKTLKAKLLDLHEEVEIHTDRSKAGQSYLRVRRYRELSGQSLQRSLQRSLQNPEAPSPPTSGNGEGVRGPRSQDSVPSVQVPPSTRSQARAKRDEDEDLDEKRRRDLQRLERLRREEERRR
jgi:hypothetical protein